MKQVFHVNLIFFIFLVISISTSSSARLLQQIQDDKEVIKATNIPHEGSFIMLQEDDLFHLMGLEKCNENDEDCVNRRMVAEAHLDYIYTQHHKPKG